MEYITDLDMKTFVEDTVEEIDKKVNEWKENNLVRFTQTDTIVLPENGMNKILHKAVVFYKPQTTIDKKKEDLVMDKEKPELWCDCVVCGKRFKYSHFKNCPNGHGIEGVPEDKKEDYKKIWGG